MKKKKGKEMTEKEKEILLKKRLKKMKKTRQKKRKLIPQMIFNRKTPISNRIPMRTKKNTKTIIMGKIKFAKDLVQEIVEKTRNFQIQMKKKMLQM